MQQEFRLIKLCDLQPTHIAKHKPFHKRVRINWDSRHQMFYPSLWLAPTNDPRGPSKRQRHTTPFSTWQVSMFSANDNHRLSHQSRYVFFPGPKMSFEKIYYQWIRLLLVERGARQGSEAGDRWVFQRRVANDSCKQPPSRSVYLSLWLLSTT